MESPYHTLGVDKNATQDEIKKAFRDKAKQHHTDKTGGAGNDAEMVKLNAAYDVLKDPARKKRYDETGETGAVPTFDKMFEGFINEAFLGIINKTPDVDHTDMLAELKRFTNDLISDENKRKVAFERGRDRLVKVLGRVTSKKDNAIGRILEQNINIAKHNISQVNGSIDFLILCKNHLEDYGYTVEPKTNPYTNENHGRVWMAQADDDILKEFFKRY